MFIRFCCKKLKKRKLDQIHSELAQIWYSNYWGPNHTTYQIWGQLDIVCFGFLFQVWFLMFLRQYIKPYCKSLKLYILSIWVDIALYLKL